MQFKPKSEKELQEEAMWPAGEYDFEVIEATPAVSSDQSKTPGTKFIKLKVRCFNSEGSTRIVNAILHPSMMFQLRHFCYETGLDAAYEQGTLTHEDCVGRQGKLRLKQKAAEGNFPAKNEVQDWGAKEKKTQNTTSAPQPVTTSETPEGDDVPF